MTPGTWHPLVFPIQLKCCCIMVKVFNFPPVRVVAPLAGRYAIIPELAEMYVRVAGCTGGCKIGKVLDLMSLGLLIKMTVTAGWL